MHYIVWLFAKCLNSLCFVCWVEPITINCRLMDCCIHSTLVGIRETQRRKPLWCSPWNSLHWRHNNHDGVSNSQPQGCLLNHLFRRRSKKTSKLRVTGLCVGNSPRSVNSPHKGPVTRKMFPFDDVIMYMLLSIYCRGEAVLDISLLTVCLSQRRN